jgi:hypothetical protein
MDKFLKPYVNHRGKMYYFLEKMKQSNHPTFCLKADFLIHGRLSTVNLIVFPFPFFRASNAIIQTTFTAEFI